MKIVKQGWEFMIVPNGMAMLELIENAGRTCYKSEKGINCNPEETTKRFIRNMIDSGHHSVIEHGHMSVRIITDRGVTHELVRHRLAEFSQESTRYCNYSKDKFGNEITIILPVWFYDVDTENAQGHKLNNMATNRQLQYTKWKVGCLHTELTYFDLLAHGQTPQEARSILPNSLKTEIVMTANCREMRHILNLRCSPKAHPQIRALMLDMLKGLHQEIPVIFDDLFDKYLT